MSASDPSTAPERPATLTAVAPVLTPTAPPATEAEVPPPTLFHTHIPHVRTDGPTIPGYAVLDVLGQGGMGVVYRARQLGLDRVVALKMVLAGSWAEPADLARFAAEAAAVAAISHPNVVRVFEYGERDGRPFLAMEYLPGGSLAALLKADGPLLPREAARTVAAIARGVQAAHDAGVVHRDLKPANVLLGGVSGKGSGVGQKDNPNGLPSPLTPHPSPLTPPSQPIPVLTDFGLAKRGGTADLTATGVVMGTPAYMAPEQAAGTPNSVGPAIDVYAVGVILFECLTGKRPFDGGDPASLLLRIVLDPPPSVRVLAPATPPDLDAICVKCLAKSPADRYHTAAALADDLERFAAGHAVSVRAPGRGRRLAAWARRRPTGAWALAVVAAGLIGIAASLSGSRQRVAEPKAAPAAVPEAAGDSPRAVGLAYAAYEAGRLDEARRLLDGCAPAGRGWEWRLVRRLCAPDASGIAAPPELPRLAGLAGAPQAVAVADDGRTLFAVEGLSSVKAWDTRSGRLLWSDNAWDAVRFLHLSADGSEAMIGTRLGRVLIRDAATGRTKDDAPGKLPQFASARTPDGAWLATTASPGTVAIVDGRTGAVRTTMPGRPLAAACRPALSADGGRVAVGGDDEGHPVVRVWDALANRVREWPGHAGPATAAAFAPDGLRLATAANDGCLKLWDPATGRELLTMHLAGKQPSVLAFSPDGSKLAAMEPGGQAWLFDAGK